MATNLTFVEPCEMGTEAMEMWLERFQAGVEVHPSILAAGTDAAKIAERQKKLLILCLGTPALTELKGSILPATVKETSYRT